MVWLADFAVDDEGFEVVVGEGDGEGGRCQGQGLRGTHCEVNELEHQAATGKKKRNRMIVEMVAQKQEALAGEADSFL